MATNDDRHWHLHYWDSSYRSHANTALVAKSLRPTIPSASTSSPVINDDDTRWVFSLMMNPTRYDYHRSSGSGSPNAHIKDPNDSLYRPLALDPARYDYHLNRGSPNAPPSIATLPPSNRVQPSHFTITVTAINYDDNELYNDEVATPHQNGSSSSKRGSKPLRLEPLVTPCPPYHTALPGPFPPPPTSTPRQH